MTSGPVSPKRAGENGEAAVREEVPQLESVPDEEDVHVDARATTEIGGEVFIDEGQLVEIKTCSVVITDRQRYGRYYLRRDQHDHLLEKGAVYAFGVCEPRPDRDLIALSFVAAEDVDKIIPDWRSGGENRPECVQIAWTNVVDETEVYHQRGESA